MIHFEIKPPRNIEPILRILRTIPGGVEKAGADAVRRTIRGGRKDAAQKIKERYTIPYGVVMKTLKTRSSGLHGEMGSSGSRNPMEKFKITPKKRPRAMPPGGVFAQIVRGQGGNIRRAFLQKNGSVYERVGRERFPLRRFYSPSAPGMISSPKVSSYIVDKMQERLTKSLNHAMQAILSGYL